MVDVTQQVRIGRALCRVHNHRHPAYAAVTFTGNPQTPWDKRKPIVLSDVVRYPQYTVAVWARVRDATGCISAAPNTHTAELSADVS